MITLIDADSLCYAACFFALKEDNSELHLYNKLSNSISSILLNTEADDYKIFLSGQGNFRKEVCPLYKANRSNDDKPELLDKAREYLAIVHNAITVDGMEADDAVCIEQSQLNRQEIASCIAHIDKDIDQSPGWHYRWKMRGRPAGMYYVSESEGLFNLYTQALVGDRVDNIMMYQDESTGTWKKDYGLGEKTAAKALEGLTTEQEMYDKCLELYLEWVRKGTGEAVTEDDLVRNMHLLYLKRSHFDKWERPL